MRPLRICYVSSEITPFAKTGGLGDVSGALPAYLHRAGHDVRVFVPLHSLIDVEAHEFAPLPDLQDIPISAGGSRYPISVFTAPLPGSDLAVHFVHCPALYDRPEIYTNDPDEALRFAVLSRAVIEVCQRLRWAPDVFHCNDWQAALLPFYLKTIYAWDELFAHSGTMLTIHNLGFQGVFSSLILEQLGLGSCEHLLDADDIQGGRVNFLKTGIQHADCLTTVSPTYAREIQTPEQGMGLDAYLRSRRAHLRGILNGVDYRQWNPSTDPHIRHRYSEKSLGRKEKNKEDLLLSVDLPYRKRVPVVGMISRLTPQKGIDILREPLPEFLSQRDLRLVVLASGSGEYERFFALLEDSFPEKVRFWRGYNTELSHRIEAGCDLFLMPSLYEPCGLNQMYSLKYGTVPIVRKTGGLADTVTLYDWKTGIGTGFVFDHYVPDAVRWALDYALDVYGRPEPWKRLMLNGMACDFSWEVQGREYVELYSELGSRSAAVT